MDTISAKLLRILQASCLEVFAALRASGITWRTKESEENDPLRFLCGLLFKSYVASDDSENNLRE